MPIVPDSTMAPATARDAVAVYRERYERCVVERDRLTRSWSRVANLRLFIFLAAVTLLGAGLLLRMPLLAATAVLPALAFVPLVPVQSVMGRERRHEAKGADAEGGKHCRE